METPPQPETNNRIPSRALTEREAEPEPAASSTPQGEDEYYDWLNDLERELESRVRDLAQDLTYLRREERNAFLWFLSSEVFYNWEHSEQ